MINMYNLIGTETIPNEKPSTTFAREDMEYILQEMGVTAPLTILYIMPGTEYEASNFKEVAESLSDQVVVAVVGPPKEFTIEETNVFLDTAMAEFCENEFIPINNVVGQYETRETFIYGNAIGELVAAFIFDKERAWDEHGKFSKTQID
jgi:hypothetical protein